MIGISGWFPVKLVENESSKAVGGIELYVKFPTLSDRKQIINVGRGSGWCPQFQVDANDESWLPSSCDTDATPCSVSFYIDAIRIPVDSAEGFCSRKSLPKIYATYRFFDQGRLFNLFLANDYR